MTQKKKKSPDPHLDPATRLCPKFDSTGIGLMPIGYPGEFGFHVEDNCAEEHIQ